MSKHTTIGFDLAKQVFHLMEIDRSGAEIQRKKLRRSQVLRYFARQPAGCSGAKSGETGRNAIAPRMMRPVL